MQAYKIHAPAPWQHDIATCEAVRHALGDDQVLMLDASWTQDYPTALRVGRALEALKFHWFEDPMGEWSIRHDVKLRQKLDTPLMATELPFAGFDTYRPWLMAQATDFLRGDVAFKGGITNMIKTAHLAEAFGMNYEIHHGSNSLNNVANLHVACAIHNCEYFEILLPGSNNRCGLFLKVEYLDGEGTRKQFKARAMQFEPLIRKLESNCNRLQPQAWAPLRRAATRPAARAPRSGCRGARPPAIAPGHPAA